MKFIKNSFYLIFFLTFLPLLISGQSNTFSKIYCPQSIAALGRHILVTDTGYIAGGVEIDSITGIQTLVLLVIDTNGNMINKIHPVSNTVRYYPGAPGALRKNSIQGYTWVGAAYDFTKVFSFLIQLDDSLNVSTLNSYCANNDSLYSFLDILHGVETFDKGHIMVGEIEITPSTYEIILLKVDSLGNKTWQKTYFFKMVSRGWNVIQTPDHGFLIGAGGYAPTLPQSYTGLIIKTDSLGNEQWRLPIGSQYNDWYCVVANAPDGNFIVGTMTGVGLASPDFSFRKARLLKINNAGSTLWDKSYGKSATLSGLGQVFVLPGGDIISNGFYNPGISEGPFSWSWILKTNSDGDSIWMRWHYLFSSDGADNELNDIKPTPDGGFILCGEADSNPVIPQSIWVLKVDSLGCLVPGCQNVGMKELVMKNEELGMYPNPASDVVTLKLPGFVSQDAQEVRLFSSTGQEVLREMLTPGNDTPTISIRHLAPGAYFVRVITAEMSVVSSKVLIIRN